MAVSREPSGYHWSQQICTPMRAYLRIEVGKSQVARREIEFFVIQRIVRNVHLAVFAQETFRRHPAPRRYCDKFPQRGVRKAKPPAPPDFPWRSAPSFSRGRAGTASARLNNSASSVRQKYSPRNNSCKEMICAPRLAASRIFSTARARFSSAFAVHFICTRPIVNLSAMNLV